MSQLGRDVDRVRTFVDAATVLAWFPWSNLGGGRLGTYHARRDAHERLEAAIAALSPAAVRSIPPGLMRAALRVAGCSFANRIGVKYAERRQAFRELRAELDVAKDWLAPKRRAELRAPEPLIRRPSILRDRRGRRVYAPVRDPFAT